MNAASQDHGPDGDRNVRSADMQLEVIDVTGLPEQVVEDIQNLVESIRRSLPAQGPETRLSPTNVTLPRWDGTVQGALSRRELYDDVG
jgi:hypothetical protein